MVQCCVLGCENRTEQGLCDFTFHRFPSNVKLKEIWIQACGRYSWNPTKNSRICSNHFEGDVIIQVGNRKFLKPDAEPTKNIYVLQPDQGPSAAHSVQNQMLAGLSSQNLPVTPPTSAVYLPETEFEFQECEIKVEPDETHKIEITEHGLQLPSADETMESATTSYYAPQGIVKVEPKDSYPSGCTSNVVSNPNLCCNCNNEDKIFGEYITSVLKKLSRRGNDQLRLLIQEAIVKVQSEENKIGKL